MPPDTRAQKALVPVSDHATQDQTLPRTRLHIRPFNSSLFDAVVNKSIQPLVTGLSYHAVQTDVDGGGFGYIELPKVEAEKLRKKFHGALLRSKTMSVEEALPRKRKAAGAEDEEADDAHQDKPERKRATRSKRSPLGQGEMAGFELPEGRLVKRAWTDPDKKASKRDKVAASKREKSKYTNDRELLFKMDDKRRTRTTASSNQDASRPDQHQKRTTVVHEFANTTKYPSFLRDETTSRPAGSLSFVDGKGWCDESGQVVEAAAHCSRPSDAASNSIAASSDSSANKEKSADPVDPPAQLLQDRSSGSSDNSDTSSISSSEASSSSEDEPPLDRAEHETSEAAEPSTETSNSQTGNMPPPETTTKKPIHPLEALYKKPFQEGPNLAPIDTGFSFFEADSSNNNNENQTTNVREPPQTPFTRQDLRMRGARSAAPTPDTAGFGPKASFLSSSRHGTDELEDLDAPVREGTSPLYARQGSAADEACTQTSTPEGASDFVKAFYDKRADHNDSWKQRRRQVMKQQRQRENKRLDRRS